MSRKCITGSANPNPDIAQAAPATGEITKGFFASALPTTHMARPIRFSSCRPISISVSDIANTRQTTINEEINAGCSPG
ncbi:hypothetical protein D3C79_1019610 [compost metagenome]